MPRGVDVPQTATYLWMMQAIGAARSDERAAILAEVDRFLRRAVAPHVARHETTLDEAALAGVLGEAEALGLAGSDTSPTGLAPWEELEGGEPPGGTIEALGRIARVNAAVALAIHQRALARVVVRRAGLPSHPPPAAIAIEGACGLGRTSIARLLAGAPLDDDDRALLSDLYAPDAERVLVVEPGAIALVTPTFAGGAMSWQVHERGSLTSVHEPHAHGLDELRTARVKGSAAARARAECATDSLAEALSAQMLALVAIALGAVERAEDIARRFAAARRQGGHAIDRHPAVLELLGQARRAIDAVRGELAMLGQGRITARALGRIAAFRADAHVRLAGAAHAAMQVAGGLGYMRETGLEKVSRDVNVLRVIAGAPPELALVAAEWERIRG